MNKKDKLSTNPYSFQYRTSVPCNYSAVAASCTTERRHTAPTGKVCLCSRHSWYKNMAPFCSARRDESASVSNNGEHHWKDLQNSKKRYSSIKLSTFVFGSGLAPCTGKLLPSDTSQNPQTSCSGDLRLS